MLQIRISNNIRIRGASTPLKAAITAALTMDNPAFVQAKQRRRPTWGMESRLVMYVYDQGDIIAPRGFQDELVAILAKLNIVCWPTVDQTEGTPVDFGEWNPAYVMRDYQEPMVEALQNGNGIGVAPAGSGKTIMGMKYIHEVGRPTLWLTHTIDLMEQTRLRAMATLLGVGRIGLLGDGLTLWGDGKLIIATVQTINANPQLLEALAPLIGVVVIDEAHHFPASQFIDVVAKLPAARVIGLTATPDRKDHLERYMYLGIGPKLYTVERGNLYDDGQLVKPEIRFIYTDFDYEQASIRAGQNVDAGGEDLDYNDLLQKLINDDDRRLLVAENILANVTRGAAIVITESVRYCFYLRELVDKLAAQQGYHIRTAVVHGGLQRYTWKVASGEKAARAMLATGEALDVKHVPSERRWKVKVEQYTEKEYQDWQVTGKQRKETLQAVRDGKIEILFATQLAREGLDIAHLAVGHMAMPKRGDSGGKNNGGAVEQEIGRIMRPDPANTDKKAVWYDYVDDKVGVLQAQYYSRRKVYTRLGLVAHRKTKKEAEVDLLDSFLGSFPM